MYAPAILKVILEDNSNQRLNFQNELPGSANELLMRYKDSVALTLTSGFSSLQGMKHRTEGQLE